MAKKKEDAVTPAAEETTEAPEVQKAPAKPAKPKKVVYAPENGPDDE